MSDIKETFDESEYDYDKITGGEEGGMSISSDLIRGHINTIILRSLYDGDKYGYDILSEIESKTGGLYSIKQPTLYSALKRLESLRYVASYYGEFSNGGRRKYFRLTRTKGKEFVKKSLSEWEYSRTIIDSLIADGDQAFRFFVYHGKAERTGEYQAQSYGARIGAYRRKKFAEKSAGGT